MKTKLLLVLLAALFLLLRFYRLPEQMNFSADQGLFFLRSWQIYQNRELTLLGPPTSMIFQGRQFFQGPAIYYSIMVLLWLAGWNPLIASAIFIGFNLLAALLVYAGVKKLAGEAAGLTVFFLMAVNPILIYFSQFLWNPNFLLLITPLLFYLLVNWQQQPKQLKLIAIGIVLGLGLQFHFQYLLVSILVSGWLLWRCQLKIRQFLCLLLGFIVGYLPMIVFELRHDFYNLRTILLILQNQAAGGMTKLLPHYWLAVILGLTIWLGMWLAKARKNNRLVYFSTLGLLLVFSWLWTPAWIKNQRSFADWGYQETKRTADIIIQQALPDYNIANLLYGDTRAQAVRYLATVAGQPPLGVEEYEDNHFLFIISAEPYELTVTNPVWEVSAIRPVELIDQWIINQSVKLFLLKRQS